MSLKSKLGYHRRKSKSRVILILVLLAILGIMFYFFEKMRLFIVGIAIILLTALGLELSKTDFDLGKFMKTGSLQESRIEQTKNGFWKIGDDCTKDEMNCSDFQYQEDAQAFFEKCGGLGNNVNRLDGNDKDGIACESLPHRK